MSRISRFRSGEGHDYSDEFEKCRSMKHYFHMKDNLDWSSVQIFSPVEGSITRLEQEMTFGTQVQIQPSGYPDFTVIIFHVHVNPGLKVGDKLKAGQLLGTHISSQTRSDIAVRVNTPGGGRLVSWFDLMTDSLFQAYKDSGILSRSQMIISKPARDADPLNCSGESFGTSGQISNWIDLN